MRDFAFPKSGIFQSDAYIRLSSSVLSIAQELSGLMIDRSAVQGWSGVKVCCMNSTVTENERKRIILRANELVIKNRFSRFAFALEGSLESVQTDLGTGLIVYNSQNTIQTGDTVSLNIDGQSEEIQIVGILLITKQSQHRTNYTADYGIGEGFCNDHFT